MAQGFCVYFSVSALSVNQIPPPFLSPSLYFYLYYLSLSPPSLILSWKRPIVTKPASLYIMTGFQLQLPQLLPSITISSVKCAQAKSNWPSSSFCTNTCHWTGFLWVRSPNPIQSNHSCDWGERAVRSTWTNMTEKVQPFQGCDHLNGAIKRTKPKNDSEYNCPYGK